MSNAFYIPTDTRIASAIHSIWQVIRPGANQHEQIMPKGVVEIIFDFTEEDRIATQVANNKIELPRVFINGFNSGPIHLVLPKQQHFFGVQLQPVAVKKLLKTPANLFADQIVDLSLIEPSFNSLWHQLAEQTNFDGRVAVFQQWALRQLFEPDSRETAFNNFLNGTGQHGLSVSQLASLLCYSPRQLTRKLLELTGMNSESSLLYKKYLHALHLVHHTDMSLTNIAYESSFSDQSHFIHSFKSYTGLTPGEYRRSKGFLKGHLLQVVR